MTVPVTTTRTFWTQQAPTPVEPVNDLLPVLSAYQWCRENGIAFMVVADRVVLMPGAVIPPEMVVQALSTPTARAFMTGVLCAWFGQVPLYGCH